MRSFLILTILINLDIYFTFSQDVEGIVIDGGTQQPIPYVHVFSEKLEIATITNQEGKFIFKKAEKNVELTFSHISYKSYKVIFKENEQFLNVSLLPNEILLSEVIINDRAYEIAKKALEKYRKNTTIHFGKSFYRQTTTNGDKPTEYIETFNDVSFSSSGVEKYRIYQSRFAKLKSDADNLHMSFSNFSYLAFGFKIFTNLDKTILKPFNVNHFDRFSYSIKNYFEKDGVKYALLEYKPLDSLNRDFFHGSFTVNLLTNSVVNFDACTRSNLGADTLAFVKDGKTVNKIIATNHSFLWSIHFSDLSEGILLEYINVMGSFDWMKGEKLETTKLRSTLIVFERDSRNKKGLKEPDIKQNDIAAVKKIRYNPKFWKDNPVVKRTQSEEDIISHFEKSNSFGNYFRK